MGATMGGGDPQSQYFLAADMPCVGGVDPLWITRRKTGAPPELKILWFQNWPR